MINNALTALCGGVDVEGWFLQPGRDGDVISNKGRHGAADDDIVAMETAWALDLRLVVLVHHCNRQYSARYQLDDRFGHRMLRSTQSSCGLEN